MHDKNGDGWQGAYIQVLINSVLVGKYSASNFESIDYIPLCDGDSLDLIYTAGKDEDQNYYELRDSSWNTLYYDQPNPDTGRVFSTRGKCNKPIIAGSHPCTAIPMDTGCVFVSISDNISSGINPYPGDQYVTSCFASGDKWFSVIVPASGNLAFETFEIDSSSIGNTWLTLYAESTCTNRNVLYCIGSHVTPHYASSYLTGLTAGETIYAQIWSCGGKGSFEFCVKDYQQVTLDSSELPIVMINTLNQTIVPETKINCIMDIKYNGPNIMTYTSDSANVYSGNIGIEIRGRTSAGYPQHPYNIETRTATGANNNVSILEMPKENDWVLISNYNDRSFLRNQIAYKLFREMGNYSVRMQMCEVLIDSIYQGVYLFGEKIRRDVNRIPIAKLSAADTAGEASTGGYILQTTTWDYPDQGFKTNYSPIDHPTFDIHFVYEYPQADEIHPKQKAYIASFIDSLETALYSANFADPNEGYRKYLDVPSFIDYFLVNEVARNADGFKRSCFYNKDKNSKGGKLKAGPVWDFDWAFKNQDFCWFGNRQGVGWAHRINDCDYIDNYNPGYYIRMLQDSTFRNELRCHYEGYRQNILDTTTIFAYIDSVTKVLKNAHVRHF